MDKLISFDVSSVSTGWSYFEGDKLMALGIIEIPSDYDTQDKLIWFKYRAHILFSIHKPTVVLVEETYLKNVKTLKTLMQFIGVLNLLCGEVLELKPIFISPNSVRSKFELKTKEDVFNYVKNKYKVKLKGLTFETGNDITDSILMGLYWLKVRESDE